MKVDIIATSSVIPQIELRRGTELLQSLGFEVASSANIALQHFAYSGDVTARADAFIEAAFSDSQILWAARGGYGAAQILPRLSQLGHLAKPAKKLLVGYSDLTALYQFVTAQWGWQVLHGPMLCSPNFQCASPDNRAVLFEHIRSGSDASLPSQSLQWLHSTGESVSAPLFGGNLAVICSMIGTPWQLDFSGKFLFIEEIAESWSKIDRMLQHLLLSGSLEDCKGIVLGQLSHCLDSSPQGLRDELSTQKVSIRQSYSPQQSIELSVLPLARQLNIPLVAGLEVGHAAQSRALAMNAQYHLQDKGALTLLDWMWQKNSSY